METLLEAIGYGLLFRPIQALAIGVFSYHAVAALLREWRSARSSKHALGSRVASHVPHRSRLAA